MEYGLVVVWWVAYVVLGLFGLPVAARLCSSLPGRGAGFSLGLSFAVFGLVGFWVGHLALGWVAVIAGLVGLAVCAMASVRGGVEVDRRAAAEALVVFTLVYLVVIAVRGVDPGITPDGEKFLDFGLVMSLYRAPTLPPEDMWFSGKAVIYYYGGHLLTSMLSRLLDVHPWYGFNLSMAGLYGALAAGIYELAGAISVGRRLDRATDALGRETVSKLGTTRALAGVTAVFFAVGAANLATAVRLVVRRLPSGLRGPAAGALASSHSQFAVEAVLAPIASNYYFKSAGRIMADLYNPFPLFAIVRGDLRPYAVSTPFLVVVVGLCYAYYRTPETHRRRRRLLLFGAIPVVVGFIVTVNTWGLAVAGGVVWLTLTFAPARLRSLLPAGSAVDLSPHIERATTTRASAALARLVGALVTAGVVGVLGIVAALPFVFGPLSSGPSTAVTTVAAGARSPLGSLLLIHGAFLAVFVAYYVARVRERWQTPAAVAVLLWFVAVVVLVPAALAPLALFGVLLATGWYFVATDRTGFEGVLVVAGLGLVLLAEVVYIKEGGGTRFNTVVKTYMPAWVLWASAVGVILPRLVRGRRRWSWSRRQVLAGALAGVLVLSTAAFGGVALTSHFANSPVEEPTLDGMAAAENNVPGQVAGIEWLDDRPGRPTIVSAASPYLYRWSAAPAASLTGLPTVIGLPHEIQFRNRTAYFNRAYAVNTIYLGTDEQRAALLDQYGVEYIYVGPTERERYGDFASFDELRGVRVAYQEDTVTIYAVDQSRLAT
ncbi:DUF2298 domain-containing protein [Halococcus hamelinensis]|uniref:Chlor_Arch_YYY domain-containing protein n=1 Tax=Halococcus hamelinensis 100A6 TaxID=1132509 RepID=M0LSZ5_9EURY|nr:DUF2298 domain-containing protein [Halococcus hamelinensis]EMA36541.1 hypothetical protein C447_14826 [Halococcus hamelinensis 100A6]